MDTAVIVWLIVACLSGVLTLAYAGWTAGELILGALWAGVIQVGWWLAMDDDRPRPEETATAAVPHDHAGGAQMEGQAVARRPMESGKGREG